jgi:hypothetical protein
VWIPDELAATLRAELPKLNVSRVLRGALEGLLVCRHDGPLACSACAASIEPGALRLEARRSMYEDIYQRLVDLIPGGGSAEGAARVVNGVAARYGVDVWPEPRRTRAEHRQDADRRAAG